MTNLSRHHGLELSIKRDDLTGVGLGGNKVRQLDFYFGDALKHRADSVLITGAVQSNFAMTTAAMAARFGIECHIQLENRVNTTSSLYKTNGNVLLDNLLGAQIHSYPDGEDEAGADANLHAIAESLKEQGKKPYVIPLGIKSDPLGALGYVVAAEEILRQQNEQSPIDGIVVASGSALTHAGLLFGLRLLGSKIPVYGVCVRRESEQQCARVITRLNDLNRLLGTKVEFSDADVFCIDGALAPGYGVLSKQTEEAIQLTASLEGIFLDPVYTGKVMAGLNVLNNEDAFAGNRIVFWHTGGLAALFAYADEFRCSHGG